MPFPLTDTREDRRVLENSRVRQLNVLGGSDWFVRFGKAKRSPSLRFFLFPFAGGVANEFRDWAPNCPKNVEVFALQLPGRAARFDDAPVTDISELVDRMLPALAGHLDRPFVFFGHSLGGRIAFALAQRLQLLRLPEPKLLAVSASRAPHISSLDVSTLSDAEFRDYLVSLGGSSREALENEALMELMLPVLRADFQLHDSLRPQHGVLECPVLAFGGVNDSLVTEIDLQGWREYTRGAFHLRMLAGGHFYLREGRRALIQALFDELRILRLPQ